MIISISSGQCYDVPNKYSAEQKGLHVDMTNCYPSDLSMEAMQFPEVRLLWPLSCWDIDGNYPANMPQGKTNRVSSCVSLLYSLVLL